MLILAFDPGLHTGVCLYESTTGEHHEFVIEDGLWGFLRWWHGRLINDRTRMADVIVYERFIIDGTRTGTWASQIEGALHTLLQFGMDAPLAVGQLRSDKASLFTQKYLGNKGQTERFNWLRARGFDGVTHELDALTHALVYLKRQRDHDTIQRVWRKGKAPSQ